MYTAATIFNNNLMVQYLYYEPNNAWADAAIQNFKRRL